MSNFTYISILCFSEEGVSPQSYDLDHIMRTYHRTSLKVSVTINITVNGSFKELESFKLLVYTCNIKLLHYIALYSWYYCHNIKLKMYINYIHTSWWNYGWQLVIWIKCFMTINWQESRYKYRINYHEVTHDGITEYKFHVSYSSM